MFLFQNVYFPRERSNMSSSNHICRYNIGQYKNNFYSVCYKGYVIIFLVYVATITSNVNQYYWGCRSQENHSKYFWEVKPKDVHCKWFEKDLYANF